MAAIRKRVTNQAIRAAERRLAEQAELSYTRLVKDQQSATPAKPRQDVPATA
jgi:hypothetical protein